uniref:proteasome endopeptidase complex n=1 Tax=Salmo trutta TaxID=8032 RepID=A0A673XB06_SALTR
MSTTIHQPETIIIALQDVCSFQDTPMSHRWNTPASLCRPMGDITPLLDMADGKDSRHTCQLLRACLLPIHSHLLVTTSGSGADCMLLERILAREIRLYQLRHGCRLSITSSAKLLTHMLEPFKGTDVCVAAILSGSDVEELIYVCSDGTRLQGEFFSVGSGSPYAYALLDGGVRWSLSEEEAISLAREIVNRATHRDAYSGNCVDLFHITVQGYSHRDREDLREEYHRERERVLKMGEVRAGESVA